MFCFEERMGGLRVESCLKGLRGLKGFRSLNGLNGLRSLGGLEGFRNITCITNNHAPEGRHHSSPGGAEKSAP